MPGFYLVNHLNQNKKGDSFLVTAEIFFEIEVSKAVTLPGEKNIKKSRMT